MDLYILRHSDAAPHGTMRDADRPLTDEGIRKMTKLAKAMREMDLSFDTILSSPYIRAKETAEITGEILQCKSLVKFTSNLASDGDPSALLKEIREDSSRGGSVLIVGHEPYLSGLISVLISDRPDVSIRFRKAGLCKLAVEGLRFGKCATLEWLISPSQIVS